MDKRKLNEKKFENWIEIENSGRRYWLEVIDKTGYKARYVKEVNEYDETLKFYQEIYDERGDLIEIHEKFPIDKGHRKIK